MLKKPLFIEFFVLSALVAILHYIALTFFLYWITDWFDIMMHFLGGAVIGLMVTFIFFTSGYIKYPNDHWVVVLSVTLGAVLIVGLTWELWEIFVGFTDVLKDRNDTILDIIMDLLGGCAAYLYSKKAIWQEN
jgi:putative flippase GtrA